MEEIEVSYTIRDIVEKFRNNDITILEWHRDVRWNNRHIETLFFNLFMNNPLGVFIVTLNNDKSSSRKYNDEFGKNDYIFSKYCIVDGYKRLHSIVASINDEIKNEKLYFYKTFGDGYVNNPFAFWNTTPNESKWISINYLYKQLNTEKRTYVDVANNLNTDNNPLVEKNVFKLYYHFFYSKSIAFRVMENSDESMKQTFVRINKFGRNLNNVSVFMCLFKSLGTQFDRFIIDTEKYLQIDNSNERKTYYFQGDRFKGNFLSILSIIYSAYNQGQKNKKFEDWLLNDAEDIKTFFDYELLKTLVEKCFAIMYITQIKIYDAEPKLAYFLYKQLKNDIQSNLKEMFVEYVAQKYGHFFVTEKDAKIFANILAWEIVNSDLGKIEFQFLIDCDNKISVEKDIIYEWSTGHPIKAQDNSIEFNKDSFSWNKFQENTQWQQKEQEFCNKLNDRTL